MNKSLKIVAGMAALVLLAYAGYGVNHYYTQPSAQATTAEAAAPDNTPFPEAKLEDITLQIHQVADNVVHDIDTYDPVKIGQVWDAASDLAKKNLPRNTFINSVTAIHQELGSLVKRQYVNTLYKNFPGTADIPAGQYITVNYLTQFSNEKKPRKEAVVFIFLNKQWRMADYSILNNM